jgi:hypothetical protein
MLLKIATVSICTVMFSSSCCTQHFYHMSSVTSVKCFLCLSHVLRQRSHLLGASRYKRDYKRDCKPVMSCY